MSEIKKHQINNEYVWHDRKHWMWFPFSFTKYAMDDERLYCDKGLFKTVSDETLLYRIIDLRLVRSLGQKIFGTGTLILCTRGDSEPDVYLVNIKSPKQVKDYLSKKVEEARRSKNVVGTEFYTSGKRHNHGPDDPDEFPPGLQ